MADISYWYEVEVNRIKRTVDFDFKGVVARSLRERKHTLDARVFVNRVGPSHLNTVVAAKRDFRIGVHTLVTWINGKSKCNTSYLYIDALAWRVYIEGGKLKAQPVWYRPPGCTAGMQLGNDPVAKVLDYYERNGNKVIAAIDEQALWRERCLKTANGRSRRGD